MNLQPKQIIEKNFFYYNEKNIDGMLSTRTSSNRSADFGLKSLISVKLINIEADDMNLKDSYFKYGRGKNSNIDKNNVIAYKVTYELIYSMDTPTWKSGTQTDYYILIKPNNNSPWLIDDVGKP